MEFLGLNWSGKSVWNKSAGHFAAGETTRVYDHSSSSKRNKCGDRCLACSVTPSCDCDTTASAFRELKINCLKKGDTNFAAGTLAGGKKRYF